MSKYLSTYYLVLFFTVSASIPAEAQEEPYAEFLTDSISVCNDGNNSISVTLRIKFHGDSPFAAKIETPAAIHSEESINQEDMDENNVWEKNYTFNFQIEEGQDKRIDSISINSVTDGNGADSTITDQKIPVVKWEIPEISAGADIDSCGLIATLDATTSQLSENYYWETPDIGNIADTGQSNTTFEAPAKGLYKLAFTQENGACVVSDTVNVTLRDSPSGTISTTSEVCGSSEQEATLELTFAGDGPWEYAITDENTSPITNLTEANTATETTGVRGQTTFSFAWIKDTNDCFAKPDDITGEATVVDLSPAPDAGNDTAVCAQTITLDATLSEKAQNGQWEGELSRFPDEDITNPKARYTPGNWGEHTLTWTEFNGNCSASDQVTIRLDEQPEARAGDDITLYYQYQTSLHAREPVSIQDQWLGEWHIISGDGNISDATSKDASISGLRHGETRLEWSVINGVCPVAADTMVITINDLTYYTGISPDATTNKYFKIKGAHTIANNELMVFDQNGQLVYRERDLEEGNQWNATDLDGQPLSSGIYYFIFKGKGIEPVKDYLIIKRR